MTAGISSSIVKSKAEHFYNLILIVLFVSMLVSTVFYGTESIFFF